MERPWWCAKCKWVGGRESLVDLACPKCGSEDVFRDEDFICSERDCGKVFEAEFGYKLGDRCPACETHLRKLFAPELLRGGKLPDGLEFPVLIEKPPRMPRR